MEFDLADAVSLPKPDLHVRLSEHAMSALEAVAKAQQRELTVVARELLTEALLGRVHAMSLAANRLMQAGFLGRGRDE
jgi:hypothetical protein